MTYDAGDPGPNPSTKPERPQLGRLFNLIWSGGVRMRDLAKRLGISGPVEPLLTALAPRLMPPPSNEARVEIRGGGILSVPAHFPSYRNYALGMYERDVCSLLPSIISAGTNVVDVGANVGFYTFSLSRLVGGRGRVFAFEADPNVYRYLLRNVADNGLDNVVAERFAITEACGAVQFIADSVERGHLSPSGSAIPSIEVPGLSLDRYFESIGWPAIDFIKLDIEGGELAALKGMSDLSARNPDIKLVMEYNPQSIKRAGVTPQRLFQAIRLLDFSTVRVVEQRLRPLSLDGPWPAGNAMYNLLLTKTDK
jgi:FkbM family methyltransferase